jgi:uncharacterized protein YqgV (UPF0045/DUF77 family)
MQATIEISMYALHDSYKQSVLDFIANIKQNIEIEVVTNGLSTQIFGDYDQLMNLLSHEMKYFLELHPTVFLLKIGKGILKFEN